MSWIDRLLGRGVRQAHPPMDESAEPAVGERTKLGDEPDLGGSTELAEVKLGQAAKPAGGERARSGGEPVEPPRTLAGGRLTLDSDTPFAGSFSTILAAPASPETDWRRLNLDAQTLDRMAPAALVTLLADLSPDVSKALWDFIRLCVSGWACQVQHPGREEPYPQAQALIDAFLSGLRGPYANQAPGADVLFGMIFATMFLRGAALMELVLDPRGRLPLNLAVPDPVGVRLRKVVDPVLGEGYELGQYQRGRWVAFDRPTIVYVPVDPLPMHPHGRPVANSSLTTVIFLVAIMNDLRRVIQQQGWPRLDLAVDFEKLMATMPPESDEPAAVQAWANATIQAIQQVYSSLEPEDAYIHASVVTVNRPVGAVDTGSLGAVADIIRALERRVVRALKTQPVFMGINEATTETHATQQWEIQAAGIRSIQHRIENALERLLVIALQAQGIQADVVFRFAELRASEMERYARTEAAQIANAIAKRDQGWITNDEAAMAITGHPAVAEATPQATESTEDTEGEEESEEDEEPQPGAATRVSAQRLAALLHRLSVPRVDRDPPQVDGKLPSDRVTIRPDGAGDGPLPLPDEVTLTEGEIEEALELWDERMADYAGLLDAVLIEEEPASTNVAGDAILSTSGRVRFVVLGGPGTRRRLLPDDNPWEYDTRSRRYRDTRSGRFLSHSQMIALRDDFVDANRAWFQEQARRLSAGEIDLQQWERQARARLKSIHADQYILGRGARKSMTPTDWGRVGQELRQQYAYLGQFAAEIASGTLSPATIASRSALYVEASTASYERGRAAAHHLVLPAYPGDGSTACRVNCRCHWRIEEGEETWNCYWTLGHAEHCADCVQRNQIWAPYTYPKR